MSVIFIKKHDENIYNITSKVATGEKTCPEHRMRVKKLRAFDVKNVQSHATMGVAEEKLPVPSEYLRKHSRKSPTLTKTVSKATKKDVYQKGDKNIPTKEEIDAYNKRIELAAKHTKNFITANIRNAIKMKPKEPVPKIVVLPNGELKTHDLEPIYIKMKTFGKTPEYLLRFNEANAKLYQLQKDMTQIERRQYRYITSEQRETILEGLKHNWEELQKEYQTLPILTDTIPKINRKSKLETDLKQLEKDIVLIERHPYIYVYDNDAM